MIEVRTVGAEERSRFDDFVASQPAPDFLQSWEWGQLKASTGWRPHALVAERSGRICAAVCVHERRLPFRLGSLFYAPRGPVLDWEDGEALAALLAAVKRLAWTRRALALKVDPGVRKGQTVAEEALRRAGFRPLDKGPGFEGVQPRFVMQLPLAGRSEDELMAAMHHKTRYNIRVAARKGVEVRIGTRADLPTFYRLLQETAVRDHFLIRNLGYFEAMWREMVEPGLMRLFMASVEGEDIAGTLAPKFGPTVWYLYGATSNRKRETMPAYALQWAMIRWALSEGCTLYDFRGVSGDLDEDNPLYGIYRFKKGFNAELVEFIGEYDLVYRPAAYLAWTQLAPRILQLRSRVLRRRAAARAGESE